MSAPKKDVLGIAVVSDKKELQSFIQFPYDHYAGNPNWVPPLYMEQKKLLDVKKNPLFKNAEMALFLAYHNGVLAGRIAAIHNRFFNEYQKVNAGFFGFFECINNQSVANLLFKVAHDWLRERNATEVYGPASPTIMDSCGVLVEGHNTDPSILMAYTKDYYDSLLINAGFEKEVDMLAYKVNRQTIQMDRVERAEAIIKQRTPGITIRKANMRKLKREIGIIRDIFNKAWANNWGFQPMTQDDIELLAKDLKMIVDVDFAHIAEIDGKPVGFSIALPDYNQLFKSMNGKLLPTGMFKLLFQKKKIDNLRVALMGVLPEYQGKGIDAMMHKESIKNGMAKGYQSAELSWVLETNTDMMRVAERFGASIEKRYRMYKMKL